MTFPDRPEIVSEEKWLEITQRIAGLLQMIDAISSGIEEMALTLDTPESKQIRISVTEILNSIQQRR